MAISIITIAEKSSELRYLIGNIQDCNKVEYEIIAVCREKDCNLTSTNNFKLIIEDSNRFKARITGIKHSIYDKILLIDSDQYIETGLLIELEKLNNDMVIIPERSGNSKIFGKMLDDWRFRMERWARNNPNPEIPAIPRFYDSTLLKKVVKNIDRVIYNEIISHEDSIIYYEAYKSSKNIGFSSKYILNNDPDLITFIKKSYKYGRYKKHANNVLNNTINNEILILINKINKNSLNIKKLGVGLGYIPQGLRAIFYLLGDIL